MQTPTLTPDDFDWLEDALSAMAQAGLQAPDWSYCEGFLTALECTRREVADDEVWPVLFGEGFRPMAHMEFVWRWRRRRAEIAAALDAPVDDLNDPRALQPQVLDLRGLWHGDPEHRGDVRLEELPCWGQQWAEGFLTVVGSWPEEWAEPRDSEWAAMLADALGSIERLSQPDRDPPTVSLLEGVDTPTISEQRQIDFDDAIWSAYDLRRLWKSLGPRQAPLRTPSVPGRNDLCPCGSGMKYKKCHGR